MKHRAYQTVFGFFEGGLTRSGVLTLCVFRPEVIKDKGYAGDRLCGGQHDGAANLDRWLRFWSPLSHDNTFSL